MLKVKQFRNHFFPNQYVALIRCDTAGDIALSGDEVIERPHDASCMHVNDGLLSTQQIANKKAASLRWQSPTTPARTCRHKTSVQ